LVDHSAYDAFALIIEAGGIRLFIAVIFKLMEVNQHYLIVLLKATL